MGAGARGLTDLGGGNAGLRTDQAIQTSPNKIRVDVQTVNVTFPAVHDQGSGLWGCSTGDAESAALGRASNALTVIDATRMSQ